MFAKLCAAGRPIRNRPELSNPVRSALELASRVIGFWKPKDREVGGGSRETPQREVDETVEEILAQLEGEHLRFQNVTSRYGNIDHVVLSRERGIFLIETKPHSGRVSVVDSKLRVNGKPPEKDFVAHALRNTYWLIEEIRSITGLEAGIIPLLVFTKASVETGRPLKGIPIADKKSLLATMRKEGEEMPMELWNAREKIAAILGTAPVGAAV